MSTPLCAVRNAVFTLGFALVLSMGCSKSTSPAASPAATPAAAATAAPTVIAAKNPFWMMYKAAHDWAPDIEAIRLSQKDLQGYKNSAGDAGLWEAAFASPSLRQYRLYTYAVADVPPDVFKGVTAGMPMAWGGETRVAEEESGQGADRSRAGTDREVLRAGLVRAVGNQSWRILGSGGCHHRQAPGPQIKAAVSARVPGSPPAALLCPRAERPQVRSPGRIQDFAGTSEGGDIPCGTSPPSIRTLQRPGFGCLSPASLVRRMRVL